MNDEDCLWRSTQIASAGAVWVFCGLRENWIERLFSSFKKKMFHKK